MPTTHQPIPGALADRAQLNSILDRAVTVSRLDVSDSLDDDLRVLARIGARFLGRAAYEWITSQSQADEEAHFAGAASLARRVHAEVADDAVLQACLFEAIYPQVDAIAVPEWVFTDLGEPAERRTFRYADMTSDAVPPPGQGLGSPWAGGGVPDLSREETLRWLYYRARRYLEAGFEALHIGQLHLIAGADRGYHAVERLIGAIRRAAVAHARRGWVILDAHSHGVARNGRLLLDATSRPLSARAITTYPEAVALVRRGTAMSGLHPGGWECDDAPVLLEVDNWHGYSLEPDPALWLDGSRRAAAGRWGWDDVSWYAHQTIGDRRGFLAYADAWVHLQGSEWHFQPVVRRSLGRAAMERPDGSRMAYYRANDRSEACPDGWGDEAALAKLFAARPLTPVSGLRPRPDAAADGLASPTASGLSVPLPVTLVGEIQEHIGGIVGDASCPWSQLYSAGPGRFRRSFAFPVATDIAFTVMTGGTGIDPTNAGGVSGGAPWVIRVDQPGQVITVTFDFEARLVDAVDTATGTTCLIDGANRRSSYDVRMTASRAQGAELSVEWF